MSCQKVVNVLAVASFAVSGAVVIGGISVYVNRNAIIDNIKSQALEAVMGGGLGGLGGCTGIAPTLPTGTNDLAPTAPQASGVEPQQASTALPVASPEF